MRIADSLLPEFDQEMASTRKALERVPSDKGAWKPHPKSFPLGHLAQLIARLPGWVVSTLKQTELDLNPPGGGGDAGYSLQPTDALLRLFDENVKKARAALAEASDEDMAVPWSLKSGGATLLTQPRSVVLRQQVLNHLFHHRGQLTVYLRLLDVPVPSIYGPSADEKPW